MLCLQFFKNNYLSLLFSKQWLHYQNKKIITIVLSSQYCVIVEAAKLRRAKIRVLLQLQNLVQQGVCMNNSEIIQRRVTSADLDEIYHLDVAGTL